MMPDPILTTDLTLGPGLIFFKAIAAIRRIYAAMQQYSP
jgi:hypothetical protein